MSPERRPMSKLLILRPHPWAYHPAVVADDREQDHSLAVRRAASQDAPGEAHDGNWRTYVADRVAALERQIERLGHIRRDWLF
jgi:hypothetical protein